MQETVLHDFLRASGGEFDASVVQYICDSVEAVSLDDLHEVIEGFDELLVSSCSGSSYPSLQADVRVAQLGDVLLKLKAKEREEENDAPCSLTKPFTLQNSQHSSCTGVCDDRSSDSQAEPSTDLGAQREPDHLDMLLSVCSQDLHKDFLRHLLTSRFAGNTEATASWLLDCPPGDLLGAQEAWLEKLAEQQREAEKERVLRKQQKRAVLAKFDLQAVSMKPDKNSKPAPLPAAKPAPEGKKAVRYLDGQVVSTRGEKYVVEKTEEWDGGSRGRVKTKGKRGKGWA